MVEILWKSGGIVKLWRKYGVVMELGVAGCGEDVLEV